MNFLLRFATIILLTILVPRDSRAQNVALESNNASSELSEDLKILQPFVGTWEVDAKLGSGESMWIKEVFTVGMAGNYLQSKTFTRDANGEYQLSHTVWRWDNQRAQIVSHVFSRDGSYLELKPTVEVVEGRLTVTSLWSKRNSPVPVQQIRRFIDDSRYQWKALSMGKTPAIEGVWKKRASK